MTTPERQPELAVVTVTHDSSPVLEEWIDSLEAHPARYRIEACVVDSGSTVAERQRIEAQAEGRVERFLALPNVGFGMGCNSGAEATEAPLILFLNPDARLASLPDRALDGSGLGGALIGGYALDPWRPLGFADPPGLRDEAEELVLGRFSRAYRRSETPAWVSGAALLIERQPLERIGGFSPAFFMYFEDADLAMRHRLAGGRVELDSQLLVRHLVGRSSGEVPAAGVSAALEGVNRLSGRRFAVRYGRPWDGCALYALLALSYAPRRMLAGLWRRALTPSQALDAMLCLLSPRRALRRLGAAGKR